MKILVIGQFYAEGFATFIADELERLRHDVVRYDPGLSLPPTGSKAGFYLNRAIGLGYQTIRSATRRIGFGGDARSLRRLVERSGLIDLTICSHDYLSPSDAVGVKKITKAPLVLWYPDPVWSFRKHMFLNAPFDHIFLKDPYLVDLLRRNLRAPVAYLPEAYSPSSLKSVETSSQVDDKYTADICTAGNLYAYRVAFFQNLSDMNIKIWGLPAPLWMNLGDVKPMVQNRFVAHSEKVRAFRGAKIVINNLNPAEVWGTNVRTFEICGAGGFQVLDFRPGLSQLFELDREVVAFQCVDDLRKKVWHYLNSPDERREIAEAGQRRAAREHTYAHRLHLLLDTVAGRSSGFPEPKITTSVH
ncbi:glycosyltransferase [Mesorhizobium sp. M1273]|uniref:CgeB family protein n=1 Tax=unclassified Mesorhizobium TaxID=325217 RepID=UPI0033368480